MKRSKFLKKLFIITLLFTSSLFYGQMLGPDDPGGDPVGEPPLGGGAPIDGGVAFLFILGAAYGGKKMFHLRKE